ncbi:MAG: serine peptidase [Candidatus Contendobacter odensis]|uniref:Probable periplasmic serine endoprotease DegP-like n=1 Tax=Candidatus Contendibacter odensensis TaxID=1400860 RepID=A0A2G6PEF7_9GAMM|nr:MAG: serine peptidase [Candidatus Contendobacter odensis]
MVNITVTSNQQPALIKRGFPRPGIEQHPFNELFKHFPLPPIPPNSHAFPAHGMGSGFIISNDGYIITNHHVIDNADEVTVKLGDRREFQAQIIGSDPYSDIALLKIDSTNLPTVKFGKINDLKVGQWVFAIGAPFGLERTVTKGIVSALGRSLPKDTYVPFIQTDVPINPGNSGGPLFDLHGQVVGINSQIFSRSGGYMGLSFAIPSDVAMDVVAQLRAKGYVTRGWLGITLQEVTQNLAQSFNLDQPQGALITDVQKNSPADKSGLQAGDVIITYADQVIEESADLPPLVGSSKPDTRKILKIIRNGKPQEITVTLGQLPNQNQQALALTKTPDSDHPRLNIIVANQKADSGTNNILVQQVGIGPAARAGVRPGDILVSLNRQKIKSVTHLQQILKKLPRNQPLPLLVKRNQGTLYLTVTIPTVAKKAG